MRKLLLSTLALAWPLGMSAQVVEYYHLDALGSVRAVTNQAGAVIERHDYLPFGEEHLPGQVCPPGNPAPACQPREFTGKERDAETGHDYFGARYYRANLGRFTTVDPQLDAKKAAFDPQRWNRYVYANDNPLRYLDPDGRKVVASDPTQARALALYINARAKGTFGFDSAGELKLLKSQGGPGYSEYYRDRLVSAINKPETIKIGISYFFQDAKGNQQNVDMVGGGGVTRGRRGGDQEVIVSGNSSAGLLDDQGKPLRDDPEDILAHELVGHAIPHVVGSDTGNAVDNENKVRTQTGGPKRRNEPAHVE